MNHNNAIFPNTFNLFPQTNIPMTNDQVLNNLIKDLNKSTLIMKTEMGKLFQKYEENNKNIIKKYATLYNKNSKSLF